MARMGGVITVPGWTGRSQVERVELYTRTSLYWILWFLILLAALGASVEDRKPLGVVCVVIGTLVLGTASTLLLRKGIRLHPAQAPLPWPELGTLLALIVVAEGLVFLLKEEARVSAAIVIVGSLAWGAGSLRDKRVQWLVYVASPLITFLPTGEMGLAAYGLGVGLFFVFTVQSSLWLLGVVKELDEARGSQAALAVAEERLRFSRDVHDVLGRRLSTIAVQAELAATLAERGDPRAPGRILEVRETAHEALREARQLARGYRPLDLATEVSGATSLLRSAGIATTADLDDLPPSWHEPVARVIREAVTNVLRHSRATSVTMTYADREVVIRNDGVGPGTDDPDGTGLATLAADLAPLGARLERQRLDGEYVVSLHLVTELAASEPASEPVSEPVSEPAATDHLG